MTNKNISSSVEFYNQLSDSYDQMMSWQPRINQEGLFFKKLVADNRVKSSLSVACNTGFYVVMFRRLGVDAVGIDDSPKMIDKARANSVACGVTVDFVCGDYQTLAKRFSEGFDIITLMTDSISHVKSRADLNKIFEGLFATLNPGGLLILQTKNYELILKNQERFQPPISHRSGSDETIFFRVFDFNPKSIEYSIVKYHKHETQWHNQVLNTEIFPYLKNDLEAMLRGAGFKEIQVYRDFNFEDFDKNSSECIIVAHKKGVLKPAKKKSLIPSKKPALPLKVKAKSSSKALLSKTKPSPLQKKKKRK
jgi:SAM-dependent methyltransferase